MILSNCFVKVCFDCGAEDAQLLANELQINPRQILSLKKREAYIGIGKKPHKVLTYPPPQVLPFKPPLSPLNQPYNFLRSGWISLMI